ncbi:Interferon lambda-2 [Lemmus lemmus]
MATLLLLGLVTMMLSLVTAGSVLPSKPTPAGTGCCIGIFQSLSLWELEVLKKAKDALDAQCSTSPFPSSQKLVWLQVQERPKALQAELALTLKVLENMTDSALGPILNQPLHTLSYIQSQLQACVSPGSPAPPHCASSH